MYSAYEKANRKTALPRPEANIAAPQPSLDALRTGAVQPTAEQMGRRVDLPDAMRVKMEDAFGADLSAVKLYESEAVAEAGANAITQGSNIAFAPGMLDFTSYGGRALLGHEISHVVSQQRGEVTGGGFLNDHALEARAAREGAMAAAGQQVAMPTAAMSSASAAPAAGPMQADKKEEAARRGMPQTESERLSSLHDVATQKSESYGAKATEHKKLGHSHRAKLYNALSKRQNKKALGYLEQSTEALRKELSGD